jgi:hypothetical protein
MRWLGLGLGLLVWIGTAAGQNAADVTTQSGKARVVRVQTISGGGMGCYMYCTSMTTVDSSSVVEELLDSPDKKKYPNRKEKRAITKREWSDLVHSIDAKAVRAVPQEGGCGPCIDLPESFLTIEYSDGSKISVSYPPGTAPAPVRALKIPGVQITFYGD